MNKKQLIQLFALAACTGILLWIAWPPSKINWVVFIAFVPLLHAFSIIDNHATHKTAVTFFISFLSVVLWNVLTTYWIKNASVFGAIAACVIVNGLLMPLPLMLYQWLKNKLPATWHMWCFIAPWLLFEFFHLNWELSWPWLTLGNALAESIYLIQWYEYTGVLGGSCWILTVNYLLFRWIVKQQSTKMRIQQAAVIIVAIAFPLGWSAVTLAQFRKQQENEPTDKATFVVVQPNHDPYHEKFDRTPKALLEEMLQLANKKTDSATDFVVFPETALTEGITENDNGTSSESIYRIQNWCNSRPKLRIIAGADTYHIYDSEATPTARFSKRSKQWYDVFNAAVQIHSTDSSQFYHKSKLVPGVERMPYPAVFGFLEDFAIELGGTSGSLGSQKEASTFTGTYAVAPVICYESVFGNYVRNYVQKGAQFICILTNDGWWGNTEGYRQHLAYASLRAIETRRCIARSANTGISCFIDATGQRQQETAWWQEAVITSELTACNKQTWYVKLGDFIGWLALLMCFSLVLKARISGSKN